MLNQAINVVILFLMCTFTQNGHANDIHECLRCVSKEDQEILESFFSYMISFECFGYVLAGVKPMAAGGFDTHFTRENTLSEEGIKQRRLRLGWETWEKYASLFPSKNFLLRLSKNPVAPSFYWVVLINKDLCLKCIEENLEIFKSVLGNSVTPQSILDRLVNEEDIFENVLRRHDALLGILFGYGRHNSIAFQKQNKVAQLAKMIYTTKFIGSNIRLTPFNIYNRDLFLIDLPRFAQDYNHSESQNLRKLYEKTWIRLSQIYQSRKFLEITLQKLISN